VKNILPESQQIDPVPEKMNAYPLAAGFVRAVQSVQGLIRQSQGFGPVSAAAVRGKHSLDQGTCGSSPLIAFPNPRAPGLNVEINDFPGIPDRIMVNPQGSLMKGRYMGPELAFRSSKNRCFEYALFRGQEPGFPVGFAEGTHPENQSGIGKTASHEAS
jgi:hypothetical protein